MYRHIGCAVLISASVLTVGLSGCNASVSDQATTPPSGHVVDGNHGRAGHEHSTADMEKARAELAKLSPEDQSSAAKQHVCPITGEMLGTMGPPKKVDVKGQQVWICCDGCREALLADPDKHLAILKKS